MRNILSVAIALAIFGFSSDSMSSQPTCREHSGGNFCQYSGTVREIYVNSGNLILLYFDNGIDVSIPQSYGINATNGGAAAVHISDNSEFAHLFYSTALAAQASGRSVTIQMRGTRSGYLRADRIWLREP